MLIHVWCWCQSVRSTGNKNKGVCCRDKQFIFTIFIMKLICFNYCLCICHSFLLYGFCTSGSILTCIFYRSSWTWHESLKGLNGFKTTWQLQLSSVLDTWERQNKYTLSRFGWERSELGPATFTGSKWKDKKSYLKTSSLLLRNPSFDQRHQTRAARAKGHFFLPIKDSSGFCRQRVCVSHTLFLSASKYRGGRVSVARLKSSDGSTSPGAGASFISPRRPLYLTGASWIWTCRFLFFLNPFHLLEVNKVL